MTLQLFRRYLGLYPKWFSVVSPVGDGKVKAARKACKNCTCGRAEAEQKVEKLELTAEQIDNPQSACGSVSGIIGRTHTMPLAISCEDP